MDCRITNIGINKDGDYVLKVLTSDPNAEVLRIGACELEQTRYEQKKL